MTTGTPMRVPPDSSPAVEMHDATTQPNADVDGLLSSVERQDEHAAMSADALVQMGDCAAAALVARLPGPLRLDRHTLRGATPPLRSTVRSWRCWRAWGARRASR